MFPCWASLCNGTNASASCFEGVELCQHTESECAGDTVEACAKYAYPSPTLYAPFVYCLEGLHGYYNNSIGGVNMSMVSACAEAAGIDAAPITACFADPKLTRPLDAAAARQTARVAGKVPADEWGTPFVLVNGVHLVDTSLLLSTVCSAWTAQDGATTPAGCRAAWYQWFTWQEAATLGVGAAAALILVCIGLILCKCCCRAKTTEAAGLRNPFLDRGS